MKLYSDIELNFLNSFWNNTDFRKLKNRSYEFAVLTNNEMNITTKHINLKMVKDKMIPHNRQLLKKLKRK